MAIRPFANTPYTLPLIPEVPAPKELDQLLKDLADYGPQSLQAIQELEIIARIDGASVQRIVEALIAVASDINCPKEIGSRCVTSLRTLIPLMTPGQILMVLSTMMNIIGDEEIGVQNNLNTLIALLERDVNGLLPLLFAELEDIVNPDQRGIYEVRDEMTIRCGEGLLKAIDAIILSQQHQLRDDTLALIANSLENAWCHEKNRYELRLGLAFMDRTILEKAIWTLARRFANKPFIDFLMQEILEIRDPKDATDTEPFPIFQAALAALLKGSLKEWIEHLIDFITEGDGSYNIIWMLGELVRLRQNDIPADMIPRLPSVMLAILNTSANWQWASHAAIALSKMWTIADQNQKHQTIQALQNVLWGTRNMLILNIDHVQASAALALGAIGQAAPYMINDILGILIARRSDPNYDVRQAVLRALKKVSEGDNPTQIPLMFTVLLGSLSDQDAKVRKIAAKALSHLIRRNAQYAATQLQAVVEAAGRALSIAPITNVAEWAEVRRLVIWMLGDIALTVPVERRQNLRQRIEASAADSSDGVREAVVEVLKQI